MQQLITFIIFQSNTNMYQTEFDICIQKQKDISSTINLLSRSEKYEFIIKHGKKLNILEVNKRCSYNLVKGCQSETYLSGYLINEKVYFQGWSESLISKGILSIMIEIYNGLSPQAVVMCPTNEIEKIDLSTFLSISKSAGFFHINIAQKQICIKILTNV